MQLTNPADKDIFARAIKEMSDSLTREAAEKDLRKGIMEKVKDTTGITPAMTRTIAKLHFTQTKDELEQKNDDILTLYETTFGATQAED